MEENMMEIALLKNGMKTFILKILILLLIEEIWHYLCISQMDGLLQEQKNLKEN